MNKVAQIKHQEKSQSVKNFSIENLYRCSLDFDFGSNDDDDDDDDDGDMMMMMINFTGCWKFLLVLHIGITKMCG